MKHRQGISFRAGLKVLALLSALGATVFGNVAGRTAGKRVDEKAVLAHVVSSADFDPDKTGQPPRYQAADGRIAWNSVDVTPGIRGFGGPIEALVVLSPAGRIEAVEILRHHETRNFVHYVFSPAYLQRYVGRSVFDPLRPDVDLDAVSRATVTVDALADTVRRSSRRMARDVLGLSPPTDHVSRGGGLAGAFVLSILCAGAVAAFLGTRRGPPRKRLRDAFLLAALATVGLWLATPFSVLHLAGPLSGRLPGGSFWWIIVTAALLPALAWGRVYCGWLCPFGALSEFLARLPTRTWRVPATVDATARFLRYGVLWLIVVIVTLTGSADRANVETYLTLFSGHGTLPAWMLVGLTLVAVLRIPRFWCRFLCPAGALLALVTLRPGGYPSRPDCPMGNAANPPDGECIRCNRCRPVPGRERSRHE